jgi:hypothetical protein
MDHQVIVKDHCSTGVSPVLTQAKACGYKILPKSDALMIHQSLMDSFMVYLYLHPPSPKAWIKVR